MLPDGSSVTALFNLPAVLICLAITALLVIGIRESARVNTTIVIIKVAVLALFVAVGAQYVNTANLHPFIPPNTGQFGSFGWSGILRGAGIIFFAYIGFDAVSTASQEAKNPGRDIPIGILVSLAICTVIYIAVGLVMTGLVPYASLNVAVADRRRGSGDRASVASADHQHWRDLRTFERDTRQPSGAVPDFLFDESRRIVASAFRQAPSALSDATRDDRNHRVGRRRSPPDSSRSMSWASW